MNPYISPYEETMATILVSGGAIFTILTLLIARYLVDYLSKTMHRLPPPCTTPSVRREQIFYRAFSICWHKKTGLIQFRYPLAAFLIVGYLLEDIFRFGSDIYGAGKYTIAVLGVILGGCVGSFFLSGIVVAIGRMFLRLTQKIFESVLDGCRWISVRIFNSRFLLQEWWWKKDIAIERSTKKKCAELISLHGILHRSEIEKIRDLAVRKVPELLKRRREILRNLQRIDDLGKIRSEVATETISKERSAFTENLSETNEELVAIATFLETSQVKMRREIMRKNFDAEISRTIREFSVSPQKNAQEILSQSKKDDS